MGGLNSLDRILRQLAEFTTLFIGNCGAQVLNLNQSLAYEDDLGDLRNSGHPGITNELWIQREQPIRFF